ncbi:UBP-type zinc finger domain-containing protein [Modestobacter muralis]|uniref:UBP-type zinc finger domain-containing protein n=1 Tax=Modestobacter muralis TaxID=1608614 RepID=UPI00147822FE
MTGWQVERGAVCGHADGLPPAPGPAEACEDCLRTGGQWVHLRRCLSCDHVGCCDSSPHRHATAHATATQHPVVASAEPREHWAWCYPDRALLLPRS